MTDHGSPAPAGADGHAVVRAAQPADAVALARVAAATFRLACDPEAPPEDVEVFIASDLSERAFTAYLHDPAHHLVLAEQEGDVVGYAMVDATGSSDPDVLAVVPGPAVELSKLYVLPAAHGHGVAPLLMEAAVHGGLDHGADTLWLSVNATNARARRFYEKSGFRRVGTKRFQVGDRVEDDDVYVLELGT